MINIGIIAFQGDILEHIKAFQRLGFEVKKVRSVEDLEKITHLIIPGGESTVIGRFLESSELDTAIKKKYLKGNLAIWGTCAGAILLGKNASPYSLNLIDAEIKRNAYGRQIDSFTKMLNSKEVGKIEAVFIRAPKITQIKKSVKILASDGDLPVLCRENKILISTFHPELTNSLAVQKYFINNF